MTTEKTTEKKAQASKKADLFKGYEEIVSLGKDNLDAAMKSGALFAKGAEAINAQVFAIARAAVEENLKASKALFTCKTPEAFFEFQNELARANYEKMLTESRKITDLTVKLAEDAAKPLADRVSVNVEVFTKNLNVAA